MKNLMIALVSFSLLSSVQAGDSKLERDIAALKKELSDAEQLKLKAVAEGDQVKIKASEKGIEAIQRTLARKISEKTQADALAQKEKEESAKSAAVVRAAAEKQKAAEAAAKEKAAAEAIANDPEVQKELAAIAKRKTLIKLLPDCSIISINSGVYNGVVHGSPGRKVEVDGKTIVVGQVADRKFSGFTAENKVKISKHIPMYFIERSNRYFSSEEKALEFLKKSGVN